MLTVGPVSWPYGYLSPRWMADREEDKMHIRALTGATDAQIETYLETLPYSMHTLLLASRLGGEHYKTLCAIGKESDGRSGD